ncbi:KHG/KDPG aldolase (Includes: 4-hydroxy-2-oxoglutarate aldolase (2-keto-4-hydroxyglutarate aldolase, KHG-aldolase); 2-dehydro-3-deoxy-phosphogluconate aldolase (Phospho-2-dehydro-3-deoxygluconate aldolase, KDPG-aldolase)) [Bradyrhizobium sp. STM 3843]|uniref:bifunctional 4-hydroxy-2-oxoglutarate aldolase/2-dehydro-3-deoxy-phosphogluconate aldolase n=1 Tax=Bradyrhizobium sp. STM 3843 TaxID=551947 RepID=UPI000240536C|nr:bifunctional 4-hydroxy-2-oxoglutarate aldolase/2-dehydro-3-deoxy-phosphogluconate aldolase [Bradyrhizobium sp. STM 3843]CCE09995.1 KHG/KDPG aldolase (Includes: 4-hydroxy-2-oxoglutarate aldolase (2-keto-4-hydroxyglutarate aldolase, KHG-aldolase); 2-dehydro-3-deoxy-phosphogluconate aldolase (Phospho-2-dehydro-3-deoxygluconate aldolase, KDPG-aldolase)) [Bradyrhizobium sp. STM 3843]
MMSMQDKRARLDAIFALAPVIPVITIEDAAQAVPLARALVKGGLRVIEITLRTQAGLDAARAIVGEVPDAVVGIGTVLTPEDYERAAKLGAAFAISPGLSIELLDAAKVGELPFAPGVQTPSDLIACVVRGYELVKFFPAVPAGGLPALDALTGPFPTVRFCPTGGINAGNAAQWLAHKKVVAIGGSWVAPSADIKAGAWAAIEQRARDAAALR